MESVDSGKPFTMACAVDLSLTIEWFRYYAGAADKLTGDTVPVGMFFLGIY